MTERIVIVHASCNDGFASAMIANMKWPGVRVIHARYNEPPPDVAGKEVWIFDFSYPRATLEALHAAASSLRLYDHHKTAEAELSGLDYCVFDMERSGCRMAWDALFTGTPAPGWVRLIEDRDLWRFNLGAPTRDLHLLLQTVPRHYARWEHIFGLAPHEIEAAAQWLQEARDRRIEMIVATARIAPIAGVPFVVTNNSDPSVMSESAAPMCERFSTAQGAAHYFHMVDGMWAFSLRSRGELDVSGVAKVFGGGGHHSAAGFRVKALIEVWPEVTQCNT